MQVFVKICAKNPDLTLICMLNYDCDAFSDFHFHYITYQNGADWPHNCVTTRSPGELPNLCHHTLTKQLQSPFKFVNIGSIVNIVVPLS